MSHQQRGDPAPSLGQSEARSAESEEDYSGDSSDRPGSEEDDDLLDF